MDERRQARKFIAGALSAYEDCAKMAEAIAASQEGFAEFARIAGCDVKQAEICAMAGKTVAEQFAKSIREKAGHIRRDTMLDGSPQSKGGHARALVLSPEQRSKIAQAAADARWRK
jgi:hypothetical protein